MTNSSKMQSPGQHQYGIKSSFTTHEGVHETLVIVRRCPKNILLHHNLLQHEHVLIAVCLAHAGTLPWRFSVNCEQVDNLEQLKNTIFTFLLFFFFFLHANIKAGGRCRSTRCRTGLSANRRIQKRNRHHLRLIDHDVCTYCLGDRIIMRKTRNTFFF